MESDHEKRQSLILPLRIPLRPWSQDIHWTDIAQTADIAFVILHYKLEVTQQGHKEARQILVLIIF